MRITRSTISKIRQLIRRAEAFPLPTGNTTEMYANIGELHGDAAMARIFLDVDITPEAIEVEAAPEEAQ